MTLPGWWEKEGQRQNARSRRQEARHASATGGRVQSGSGSSWRAKEDVKGPEHLDQLKYTNRKSYSLIAEEFLQIERHALADGREGRLIIRFENHGVTVVVTRYEEGT